MAEGEVDDRVDLDEENYEEMDDEGEEQVEEDGSGGGEDDADEEEEDDDEDDDEEEEDDDEAQDSGNGASGKEQSPDAERGHMAAESAADEEKPPIGPIDEEEREKHAELLALPPHGSEVFIGGLPRECTEGDLKDLCDSFGDILEVRLMKDRETGENKGYSFVAFKTKEVAQQAIEELHSKEFKGKTLRCSLSETKHRLFIGNVPKGWTEDEFRRVVEEVGPGVETIELIKDPQNPTKNRGFAFVLYYNNACADYSRHKMASGSFKLNGNTPTVTWADPKSTPDHTAAAQVKALYVKNIPENTSTEQLKELFQRHGEVTKVVMPPGKGGQGKRDFGFVHYAERSSALKAVKESEKYEIDGQPLEVVLAKPQTERKPDGPYPYAGGPHGNSLAHQGGYGGYAANPYGAGYGVAAAGFQQPMIYGRGPMPAGMQMVPMVLPDGRIGYVLQQPGVQIPAPRPPRRMDRNSGRGGGDEGNRGRRYRPY